MMDIPDRAGCSVWLSTFTVPWQSSSLSLAPGKKAAGVGQESRLRAGTVQILCRVCDWHTNGQHLNWLCRLYFPKCWGCAEAVVQLFLQRLLNPADPCSCWCEIMGFTAFPSVTSMRPVCPWMVFAFLSQEHTGETLPFISLFSHTVCLLFAPMAKIKAAFACVVHSWL